jgi:hypothetical protein
LTAIGDAHPIATIAGPHAGFLDGVGGLAVDSRNYLYASAASQAGIGQILVFAPDANGDVAPVRTITAKSHGGVYSVAIALDASNRLWVGNLTVPSIEEFAAGADGDVAPIRTIAGSATQLVKPSGIAIDRHRNIWVADYKAGKLMKFAANARGNVAPIQVIAGAATNLTSPYAVAVDGTGGIWVSNVSFSPPARVYGFHDSDNGNVAPSQTIAASPGQYDVNGGPAYISGKIIFPGIGGGQSVVLDTYTATLSGTARLLRTIAGPNTGLASTGYVAVH